MILRALVVGLFVLGACTEQHDPRRDWQKFENERLNANRVHPKLTADGRIPTPPPTGDAVAEAPPVDEQYQNFCASCHGTEGAGDGTAGKSLNPQPRNFQTWDFNNDVPSDWKGKADEYIATVIRDGGAAVGKSSLMTPWGGVLSTDEKLSAMVEKVKSFRR